MRFSFIKRCASDVRPVDIVVTLYSLANIILIALFFNKLDHWRAGLVGFIICLALQAGLIFFHPFRKDSVLGKLHAFLRDWYPYSLTGWLYPAVGMVAYCVIATPFDHVLIDFERAFFTTDVSLIFHKEFPNIFIHESMHFFYFFFYLFPFTVSAILYKKRNKFEFQRFYFVLMLMITLQFYFFILVPTAGPKWKMVDGHWVQVVPHLEARGPFSAIMHHMLGSEIPVGAFPSSHVSITFMCTMFIHRFLCIRFSAFFWFMFVGLVIATVYTVQHYAIDSVGGLLYAGAMYKFGNYLFELVTSPATDFYQSQSWEANK